MRLVYLGNWVANAIRTPDNSIEEFEEMEQYIFSMAKEQGLEDHIEYYDESEHYCPTKKFEDEMREKHLDDYDDETFWNELTDRLTKRDLMKKYGEEEFFKMSQDERINKIFDLNEIYEKEFCENGTDNVLVKNLNRKN